LYFSTSVAASFTTPLQLQCRHYYLAYANSERLISVRNLNDLRQIFAESKRMVGFVRADKYGRVIDKITMVTMGVDLQPDFLADRLLTGLGQPQINP